MSTRRRRRNRSRQNRLTESGLRHDETPFEQSVEARLKDLERAMKGRGGAKGYTAKLPRMIYSNVEKYAPYLACLLDPWNHQSYIPDNGVYPGGLRVVRSSGTGQSDASGRWELGIKPSISDMFSMSTGPCVGTTYMDGVTHTSALLPSWDVHGHTELVADLVAYRVVACGLKLEYQGNLLNATGRAAVALVPPRANSSIVPPVTEDEISDYTYAWIGTAVTPSAHVWLPTSDTDFLIADPSTDRGQANTAEFRIGYAGMQVNSEVIRWEVSMVVEVFSYNQMITPARSGPSIYHPGSLDYQLHAARALYEEGMTSHEGEPGSRAEVESGFFSKAGKWLRKNALPAAQKAWEVGEVLAPLVGPLLI